MMVLLLLPPSLLLEAETAGAADRKGELTKPTDDGSTAAEYWLGEREVADATAAATLWKSEDCGVSLSRLVCITVVSSSVGVLPRFTRRSKRTPELPGAAAARSRLLTMVVWPVAVRRGEWGAGRRAGDFR